MRTPGAPPTRLVIARVGGTAEVQSLLRTGPDDPNTIALADFTRLPVSAEYDSFVRRPIGVIARDFGHGNWMMLVSSPLQSGKSWQLGTYLAHALEARGQLAEAPIPGAAPAVKPGRLVVATGAMQQIGMVVTRVGHIPDKLTRAMPLLREARSAGQQALFLLPEPDLAEIPGDLLTQCRAAGIEIHGVSTVLEALQLLGVEAAAAEAPARQGNPWQGSPWPGLIAYSAHERQIFFGRDQARQEALERLQLAEARSINGARRPFLLIHGPSGVGKSSFVLAGLVGDVMTLIDAGKPWTEVVMTFAGGGSRPNCQLAQALIAALGGEASEADPEALVSRPGALRAMLDAAGRGHILLVLDQFEQALLGLAPAEAEGLGVFLDRICATGRVWILATIRSGQLELLYRCAALSALAADARQYRLVAPDAAAFARIIGEPARAVGIEFDPLPEGGTLADVLAEEATASPDSLPLLQLALSRLYGYAQGGRIGRAEYDRMGGLAGAAATSADEAVATLIAEGIGEDAIHRLLAELVQIDPESGQALARAIPAADAEDPARTRIAAHLADARLLVELDEGQGPQLRLAHEALILHWPRLSRLVDQIRSQILLRDEIEVEARTWDRANRRAEHLRRGRDRIGAAEKLRDAGFLPLSPVAVAHIAASVRARRQELRRRFLLGRVLPAAVAVVAVALAAVFWVLEDQAKTATARAENDLRAAQTSESRWLTEIARRGAEDGRGADAIAGLLRALPQDLDAPERPTEPHALAEFLRLASQELIPAYVDVHDNWILGAAYSRDGQKIITASQDGTAAIVDATSGLLLHRLSGHEGQVNDAALSPDGAMAATTSEDGSIRLWDATTGGQLALLAAPNAATVTDHAEFAADGKRLLVLEYGWKTSAILFDPVTQARIATIPVDPFRSGFATFTAEGDRILSGSDDGSFRIYDASDGRALAATRDPLLAVKAAILIPGTDLAAIGYSNGALRLWNTREDRVERVLSGHSGSIDRLVLSPDGRQMGSISSDGTALLWNVAGDAPPLVLGGHGDVVKDLAYLAGGQLVVTIARDGFLRLWAAENGALVTRMKADGKFLHEIATAPEGMEFTTAGGSARLTLWSLDPAWLPLAQQNTEAAVEFFGPVAGGDRIIMAMPFHILNAAEARLIDLRDGSEITRLGYPSGPLMAAGFARGAAHFWTATREEHLVLWRLSDGGYVRFLDTDGGMIIPALSPDGRMILTARARDATMATAGEGTELYKLKDLSADLTFAIFSEDSRLLVTAGSDGGIILWEAATGQRRFSLDAARLEAGDKIDALGFSQDGRMLFAGTSAGRLFYWVLAADAAPRQLPLEPFGAIYSFALSEDARSLALGLERDAVILDLETQRELVRMRGHDSFVLKLGFAPGGTHLITAGFDGTVRIWDTTSGLPVYVAGTPAAQRDTTFGVDGSGATMVTADGRFTRIAFVDLIPARDQLARMRLAYGSEFDQSEAPAGAAGQEAAPGCDQLAANPFDPARTASGVLFDQIRSEEAIITCREELAADPGNARLTYQLGRALDAAGEDRAAMEAYETAAAAGYAMALNNAASGLADPAEAFALYEKAFASGVATAGSSVAERLWKGEGVAEDRDRAVAVWREAIEAGDPHSARALGRVMALGLAGPRDIEAGARHFLQAALLFERFGLNGTEERQIAATIARNLPAATVAQLWREMRPRETRQ